MESLSGKVLTIQSWVTHGFVGNRCSLFSLELLGFEVDAIHTVQLSNHTGYKIFKGTRLDEKEFKSILEGLELNNFMNYSHLLTGYIGNEKVLSNIKGLVKNLKEKNNTIYVLDPVMGDYIEGESKLYVPKECIPLYKELIEVSDLILPNRYEAEILTNMKIENEQDALKSIEILHKLGAKNVVLKSLEFEKDHLLLIASNQKEKYKILVKRKSGYYSGTGDLIASLLMATITSLNLDNFQLAFERAVSTVQLVIENTPEGSELFLVQSRKQIMELKSTIKSIQL